MVNIEFDSGATAVIDHECMPSPVIWLVKSEHVVPMQGELRWNGILIE